MACIGYIQQGVGFQPILTRSEKLYWQKPRLPGNATYPGTFVLALRIRS